MSSLFVHVTVAPTGTVIVCGPNTKLSILTAAFAAEGWSLAVTVGDPATNSTIAMITEAVKLASQTLFRFIVLSPLAIRFFFLDFVPFGPGSLAVHARLELTTAGAAATSCSRRPRVRKWR